MRTVLAACALAAAAGPLIACEARSGAAAPVVVELYTSEGCSSCPPADRWLSSLKGRADVLPLAFHVDYWDRLGWADRFASAAYTERQQRQQQRSGARFVYTPQVIADGADWRRWPSLPAPRASTVELKLERRGATVQAQVTPAGRAPSLAAYWAVVEDGLTSNVRAGENAGATLHHDHVVRRYEPVSTWRGARTLSLDVPAAPNRRVVLVIEDDRGRPVQALALGC
jgi:hypothetical protein